MKRHPALIPLSREHHQLLLLAQLLKRNAPQYKGMPQTAKDKVKYAKQLWGQLISAHLEQEETALFPTIAACAPALAPLLDELKHEHEQLRSSFELLDSDVSRMNELGWLLEHHVRKEERMLFEQTQSLLSDAQLLRLKTLLSAD